MGNTYIHYELANTLAQRDYKMPQAVTIEEDDLQENGAPNGQNHASKVGGCDTADTLNAFDNTDARTPILVIEETDDGRAEEGVVPGQVQPGTSAGSDDDH